MKNFPKNPESRNTPVYRKQERNCRILLIVETYYVKTQVDT